MKGTTASTPIEQLDESRPRLSRCDSVCSRSEAVGEGATTGGAREPMVGSADQPRTEQGWRFRPKHCKQALGA
jgi:hypothetical protein